jgi:ethanolamine utilization protein EutP
MSVEAPELLPASFAVIGEVDAGKSALITRLVNPEGNQRKTQAPIYYPGSVIDTPGEYVDNRAWNGPLLSTISSVNTIVYLQPANAKHFSAPPGLLRVYPNKKLIGVISKVDIDDANIEHAENLLETNGIKGPYFYTSIHDDNSINKLRTFLCGFNK